MTDSLDRREFATALISPMLMRAFGSERVSRISGATAPAIEPPSVKFMAGLPGLMEVSGIPGIGMILVQDRQILWQHYGGVMDTASGQAVSPESVWPAASLSKPVFALAALRLIDDRKLDLDRPLRSYVPGHAPDDARGDRITARHVLSHSSGLRNWRGRAEQPLVPEFDPGARFQYSGEGFYYLQRAVEHITGTGFEQFMQERLLVPLAMTSSTFSWRADLATRLVSGHDQGVPRTSFAKDLGGRLLSFAEQKGKALAGFTHEELVTALQSLTPTQPALPNNMLPNAAASLLTTPRDYGAFLIEMLNGGHAAIGLKPATRALMFAPQSRINSALSWGLGVGLERSGAAGDGDAALFAWHWGDNGSWKNFVLAHPASRSALVIFTNGSRGLNVARRVLTAATGQERASFLWL